MLDSDIKKYHAQEVSKLASNGGRCGTTEIISGVLNNVWPQVPKASRIAGDFLYRKIFTAAEDDLDGTLMTAQEYIDRPTLGDDVIVAFVGTATDTQGDITGSDTGEDTRRKWGSAYIKNALTAGNSTITVTVEEDRLATGAEAIFQAGDKIQLKNKVNPDDATGNQEDHVIDTIDSVVGLDVTFTVVGTFANDYAVDGNSRVVGLIDYGDVRCWTENYNVTTAGDYGFDSGSHPVTGDNIGTVEDHLTGEYTDGVSYTVTGSSGRNYGTGSKDADFAPTNSEKSDKPFFKIEAAAHTGTPQAGDKFELDIHEAKYATWYRQTIPTDCPSLANNKMTAVTVGESDS